MHMVCLHPSSPIFYHLSSSFSFLYVSSDCKNFISSSWLVENCTVFALFFDIEREQLICECASVMLEICALYLYTCVNMCHICICIYQHIYIYLS